SRYFNRTRHPAGPHWIKMTKEMLKKWLDRFFIAALVLFMLSGSIIVAVQLYGILTANGSLTSLIMSLLGKPAFIAASVTGLLGFVEGYLHGWKSED
ncbi:MAG: hypothetical protein ACRENG_13690, partial [bacterium]